MLQGMAVAEPAIPTEGIVQTVRAANGGVIVAERGAGVGYVVAVGRGVPWLNRGDKVWFKPESAVSLRVRMDGIPAGSPPINYLVSDNDGTVETAFIALVDQRDVLGVEPSGYGQVGNPEA